VYNWRITKYDPKNRNLNGSYLKKEWTSYSDIGKIFENNQFTVEDYLKIENAYIDAIIFFMECMNIHKLKVVDLENHNIVNENDLFSEDMIKVYKSLKNGQLLTKEKVKIVSRLILRELLWCKLESQDMYIHFGYDYYMYIGSKDICKDTIAQIERSGLYVEAFRSPYANNE
jgi:hypothetical protein